MNKYTRVFITIIGILLIGGIVYLIGEIGTLSNQVDSLSQAEQVNTPAEVVPHKTLDEQPAVEPEHVAEFGSLLMSHDNYSIPFGAAEIEGYHTTVERFETLDGSGDAVSCSAFVVTGGPDILMEALTSENRFGTPPTLVLGSEPSYYGAISDSTQEAPVRALITTNTTFEGEVIGCMRWPLSTITAI